MWTLAALDTIVQDLRYGVRMMRRSPALAVVAIASLGIGIGGAAAVFGLADALLMRELPVKEPRQLALFRWASGRVSVFESLNGNAQRNEQDFSVSSTSFSRPAFDAMRTELADRADVFGFAELYRVNLSLDGRADVANGYVVSGNYDRDPGRDRRQPIRFVTAVQHQPIVSAGTDRGCGHHARGVVARRLHPGAPGFEGRPDGRVAGGIAG